MGAVVGAAGPCIAVGLTDLPIELDDMRVRARVRRRREGWGEGKGEEEG